MTIIVDLTGQTNAKLDSTAGLSLSCPNYIGHSSYTSGAVADLGDIAVKLDGTTKARLLNLDIGNISGNCIDLQNRVNWQDVIQLSGFHLHDSWCGIYAHNAGESLVAANGHICNCVFGAWIDSGNNELGPVQIVFCSIGIKISGGPNNAHGTINGAIVRHCVYLLSCQDVSYGEEFNGCVFVAGQAGTDQGLIQIANSQGINFSGGQIAYADISIDATSQVSMKGVVFRGPVNVTVASGGVLDAKDNVVMPGATVTLNGSAWTGNN